MDHIFATAVVERRGGRADTGWPRSLPLSLSLAHRRDPHRFPSSSHPIGGGLEEEAGATIAADGELERSSFEGYVSHPVILPAVRMVQCV